MAEQRLYNEQSISNIASAIREATGEDKTFTVAEMDEAILDIHGSLKALEIAVKAVDMGEKGFKPTIDLNEDDYTIEVLQDIQRLINNIEGGN